MDRTPLATGVTRASHGSSAQLRVAVLAINAGNTNLGDEAVLSGAVLGLRNRLDDPEITVLSVHPTETSAQHDVGAIPLRIGSIGIQVAASGRQSGGATQRAGHPGVAVRRARRLWALAVAAALQPVEAARLALRLHGTDMMVVAGSNQLEDTSGGAWGYPFMIVLCCLLARLAGARVAFLSVGAGPLGSRLSGWFAVTALRMASYVSFRDRASLELMRRHGFRGDASVVPDLAYALPVPPPHDMRRHPPRRMALNVFPFRDPRYDTTVSDDRGGFAAYIDALAEFVAGARSGGLDVVLFGTQRADAQVIDRVCDRVRERAPLLTAIERRMPVTQRELTDLIASSDVVVATRYHGILIATRYGLPTIGICYQPKSRHLLDTAGLGEFAVDADGLRAGELLDQLEGVLADRGLPERIRARAVDLHAECRRGIDDAVERCFPRLLVAPGA